MEWNFREVFGGTSLSQVKNILEITLLKLSKCFINQETFYTEPGKSSKANSVPTIFPEFNLHK